MEHKNFKDLEIGDKVYCYDLKDGQVTISYEIEMTSHNLEKFRYIQIGHNHLGFWYVNDKTIKPYDGDIYVEGNHVSATRSDLSILLEVGVSWGRKDMQDSIKKLLNIPTEYFDPNRIFCH